MSGSKDRESTSVSRSQVETQPLLQPLGEEVLGALKYLYTTQADPWAGLSEAPGMGRGETALYSDVSNLMENVSPSSTTLQYLMSQAPRGMAKQSPVFERALQSAVSKAVRGTGEALEDVESELGARGWLNSGGAGRQRQEVVSKGLGQVRGLVSDAIESELARRRELGLQRASAALRASETLSNLYGAQPAIRRMTQAMPFAQVPRTMQQFAHRLASEEFQRTHPAYRLPDLTKLTMGVIGAPPTSGVGTTTRAETGTETEPIWPSLLAGGALAAQSLSSLFGDKETASPAGGGWGGYDPFAGYPTSTISPNWLRGSWATSPRVAEVF